MVLLSRDTVSVCTGASECCESAHSTVRRSRRSVYIRVYEKGPVYEYVRVCVPRLLPALRKPLNSQYFDTLLAALPRGSRSSRPSCISTPTWSFVF